jgi:hypothetical protein
MPNSYGELRRNKAFYYFTNIIQIEIINTQGTSERALYRAFIARGG